MKVGDKVVCIKKGNWTVEKEGKGHSTVPVFNDIVTISKIMYDNYLEFYEHGEFNLFAGYMFRKIIKDHTFTNELTNKLANKPLIKEGLEIIKEKELA
jgi:hypothetical protein